MPRKRKYDYSVNYPVKTVIYVTLPIGIINELEEKGYTGTELSKLVERYLVEFAEKNRKKD